jgi:Mce-associated membrane protein
MTQPSRVGMPGAGMPRAVLVWLSVLAAGLLVAAAVLAALRLTGHRTGASNLSSAEQAAVNAARQETINLQTYRRASFDADFAAALAGLTPAKATQWQANKATLKSKLSELKQDAGATVSGAGLVSFDGRSAVVMVASDTLRVDAAGKSSTAAQNRSQVSMKLIDGKWLMDDLQSVSVS